MSSTTPKIPAFLLQRVAEKARKNIQLQEQFDAESELESALNTL